MEPLGRAHWAGLALLLNSFAAADGAPKLPALGVGDGLNAEEAIISPGPARAFARPVRFPQWIFFGWRFPIATMWAATGQFRRSRGAVALLAAEDDAAAPRPLVLVATPGRQVRRLVGADVNAIIAPPCTSCTTNHR